MAACLVLVGQMRYKALRLPVSVEAYSTSNMNQLGRLPA